MDLSKIMAVSGKSGLYKILSQTPASIIVESLNEKKKMPVFPTQQYSVLEDISMFTYDKDIPLKKVLWDMYQKEEGKIASIDPKANANELKKYFETIVPDYDKERVYQSDIKKLIIWYNELLKHNLISEPKEEKEEDEQKEETKENTKITEAQAMQQKKPMFESKAPKANLKKMGGSADNYASQKK